MTSTLLDDRFDFNLLSINADNLYYDVCCCVPGSFNLTLHNLPFSESILSQSISPWQVRNTYMFFFFIKEKKSQFCLDHLKVYTDANGNWLYAIIFRRHFRLMWVYKYTSHKQRLVVAIMKNLSVVRLCDMANTMVAKLLSLICIEKRMMGRQELVLLWYLLCYTNWEACSTVNMKLKTFSSGHIYVFS